MKIVIGVDYVASLCTESIGICEKTVCGWIVNQVGNNVQTPVAREILELRFVVRRFGS